MRLPAAWYIPPHAIITNSQSKVNARYQSFDEPTFPMQLKGMHLPLKYQPTLLFVPPNNLVCYVLPQGLRS